MALTQKMLQAMDIPEEKIDQIIEAHKETVNGLKADRDKYKEDAEKLPDVQKQLDEANKKLEKVESGDWENKYNTLKGEYDGFKADTEKKAVQAKKEAAYRKLLKDAGVSESRIDTIIKVSGSVIDGLKFDKDDAVEDSEKLTGDIKKEWADFIQTTSVKGANVSNPPANNGGNDVKKPSRATELVAKYRNEHYGNPVAKED